MVAGRCCNLEWVTTSPGFLDPRPPRARAHLLVSYLVRPWPSWAQAKKVKISEGFYILGVGDQERSYFGVIRLVSSSIDYEPPSRGLSRSGDHGQVCSALSPRDRRHNVTPRCPLIATCQESASTFRPLPPAPLHAAARPHERTASRAPAHADRMASAEDGQRGRHPVLGALGADPRRLLRQAPRGEVAEGVAGRRPGRQGRGGVERPAARGRGRAGGGGEGAAAAATASR